MIFLKNPADPSTRQALHNAVTYTWEISFSELNLVSKLGSGQFADVYRGDWLDTEIAVKQPRGKALDNNLNEDEITVFLREVKLMSSLHHPNIVLFLGACITVPNISLVLEYLSGGSVFEYINSSEGRERALADSKANATQMMSFSIDVARGMKYLHHRAGIIQRDLKSSNLLIDHTLTVKICDFGLSKHLNHTATGAGGGKGSAGPAGAATPYTVAPEVIRNEKCDSKADVFSFAVCLWELYHNELPHEGMTGPELA